MAISSSPTAINPAQPGIGLRAAHHGDVAERRPAVGFLEVHAENYMGGGRPIATLEALRRHYPLSVHGVGLSLASVEGLDLGHVNRLASLCARLEPALVSEHLAWNRAGGVYLNDLLPIPYSEEALGVVGDHVAMVQDRLKRRLLIENPSAYLRLRASVIPEAEFLAELVRRTGCGILCDVNNVYVNSRNHGGDPRAYLKALPASAVGEIHLAGHAINDADGQPVWIDDHGSPVAAAVWDLYAHAVRRFPHAVTLVEWDSNLPSLDTLTGEARTAARIRASVLLSELSYAHAA
ncbi:MAG: DUF692 domain-containing protein [Alphaproteobacteria bacterium]|nr:DUF692 domain-containing protein [Alphaproteobacteria bacterium]